MSIETLKAALFKKLLVVVKKFYFEPYDDVTREALSVAIMKGLGKVAGKSGFQADALVLQPTHPKGTIYFRNPTTDERFAMEFDIRAEDTSFKMGDMVSWESQSQGSLRKKLGLVIGIVPPNTRPDKGTYRQLWTGAGPGFSRNHESYIVNAQKVTKGKPSGSFRLYWPRVADLKAVPHV